MPLLRIQTNQSIDDDKARELIRQASRSVADMLGKPERYVMVDCQHNPHMLFAGDAAPLAYLELKSIGLPEQQTADYSARLCELIHDQLGIPGERVYIEFANAERHMWGMNGATF